jgi:hypothetical protein
MIVVPDYRRHRIGGRRHVRRRHRPRPPRPVLGMHRAAAGLARIVSATIYARRYSRLLVTLAALSLAACTTTPVIIRHSDGRRAQCGPYP